VTFDGWQSEVQQRFAVDIYHTLWDNCTVIENDSHGSNGEFVAQMLDFGDVDKIVQVGTEQVFMAQRFRKPYFSHAKNKWCEPDFTLRYSRPYSDEVIEYERLMNNVGSERSMYPSRYAFGRVHNDHDKGIYEMYIFNTDELINSIKTGKVPENGPRETKEGQEFMWYRLDDILSLADEIVAHSWDKSMLEKSERPENPQDITQWAND